MISPISNTRLGVMQDVRSNDLFPYVIHQVPFVTLSSITPDVIPHVSWLRSYHITLNKSNELFRQQWPALSTTRSSTTSPSSRVHFLPKRPLIPGSTCKSPSHFGCETQNGKYLMKLNLSQFQPSFYSYYDSWKLECVPRFLTPIHFTLQVREQTGL